MNKLFEKQKNISQNMTIVEASEDKEIVLARISTNIIEHAKDSYIIQITEFYSNNDNYSFKNEVLKQFSEYLKRVEEKYNVTFKEIRMKCRNIDKNKSTINLKLIQKTFAPLIFEKYAIFFFDENKKAITLTEFVNKPMCVGVLKIIRRN